MRRRGFVFTLDAMLAILLVTIFITSVAVITENQVYSTYLRSQSKYIAQDTLMMLRTVPLNQLVPEDVMEAWENNGTIDLSLVDPNRDPLDIVATYWATAPIYPEKNLRHKAEVIMGYLLNQTLSGYNYELLINNYTSPYLRKVGSNYSKASDVSPATLVMSGYAYNQTPRGYMARAYLTRAGFIRSDLFGIQRVLARCAYYGYYGWQSNVLKVSSHFRFPSDANIEEADLRLVQRTSLQNSQFSLNGHRLTAGYYSDITDYLKPGDNVLNATFTTNYPRYCYEIGYGSGSMMYVKYKTRTVLTSLFDPVKRYGELYDVQSYTGIYYLNALFAPGNITGISLTLTTEGVQNIRIYYSYGANYYELVHKEVDPSTKTTTTITSDEIAQGLERYGFNYQDISKTYFNIVIALDAQWDEQNRSFVYDTTYRLRHLYGNGESVINIDYIPLTTITRYSIPLSIFKDYGDITYSGSNVGVRYRKMSFTYHLPSFAEPWYVDVWTAIQFTTFTPTAYTTLSENGVSFYDYYSDIYMIRAAYTRIDPRMMVPGKDNTYVAESSDVSQYGFRYQESRAIINYFVQAYAGYGDVFPKYIRDGCTGYNITYYWQGDSNSHYILAGDGPNYCTVTAQDLLNGKNEYAVDDAIIRLFNNLGGDGTQSSPILVELPESVNIDLASMGQIPGLFQPIQITLRVWRED
jgi:hypothetical protein